MKLLVKIALILFVILILLFGLQKLYDFALQHNVNLKAAYIQKEKIDAEIIFHGPCEPLWMISPKQIDSITHLKSYNLALSHSDFADNYLHLLLFLKNNKAPQFLFLYVTPESMDAKYNTFNTYRFAPYLNDRDIWPVVAECDSAYYQWTSIPFMKYAYYNNKYNFNVVQGLKHYFTDRKQAHFPDGYEPPFQVVWDNHLEKFIELYPEGYNFKWDGLREKYLRQIIRLCQRKKITIYLYESPVLKEALPYQPNRNEMVGKIKSLAAEYGIQYVQFQDMDIAESREYYMSTLNTNIKGSAIFNDSLAKFIVHNLIDKKE